MVLKAKIYELAFLSLVFPQKIFTIFLLFIDQLSRDRGAFIQHYHYFLFRYLRCFSGKIYIRLLKKNGVQITTKHFAFLCEPRQFSAKRVCFRRFIHHRNLSKIIRFFRGTFVKKGKIPRAEAERSTSRRPRKYSEIGKQNNQRACQVVSSAESSSKCRKI